LNRLFSSGSGFRVPGTHGARRGPAGRFAAVIRTGLLLAAMGALAAPAARCEAPAPAAEATPGSKLELTPQSAPQLLKLVRPHGSEWRHLNVQWLTDVVAARKQAAAEDKPIIICYTGGAGYNEPLGVC
jgi:hypothetical protein